MYSSTNFQMREDDQAEIEVTAVGKAIWLKIDSFPHSVNLLLTRECLLGIENAIAQHFASNCQE